VFEWFRNDRRMKIKGIFFNQVDISEGDFVKVVPVGNFPEHPDGPHEITPADIQSMERNFNSSKKDLLFDYEHGSLWGKSRAAGWSNEVKAQPDGLYVKYPAFTPAAKEMIVNREFRYFSPVYFMKAKDKLGRDIGAKLDSVALTNIPYMDNEIDSIKNDTSENPMDKELLKKLGLPETATAADVDTKMTALRTKLALPADATLDQIIEASGKKPDAEGASKPAGEGDKTPPPALTQADVDKAVDKKMVERDAEVLVNSAIADGKILPAEKEVWINSARADLAKTRTLLDARPKQGALPGKLKTNSDGKGAGSDKKSTAEECTEYFKQQGRHAQ